MFAMLDGLQTNQSRLGNCSSSNSVRLKGDAFLFQFSLFFSQLNGSAQQQLGEHNALSRTVATLFPLIRFVAGKNVLPHFIGWKTFLEVNAEFGKNRLETEIQTLI